MLVLRYFDAVNFAGMVSCKTLIGLGLNDPVRSSGNRLFYREPFCGTLRNHGIPREPHRAARGAAMGGI